MRSPRGSPPRCTFSSQLKGAQLHLHTRPRVVSASQSLSSALSDSQLRSGLIGDSRPETAAAAAHDSEGSLWKRRMFVWAFMCCVVIGWWIAGTMASGQQFEAFQLGKQFQVFKDPKRAAELERAAGQMVTARTLDKLAPNVPGMTNFYLKTYIPWKMTQKENLPELTDIVEGLLKNLDRVQRSEGAGLRTLLAGTYMGMKTVAEGNYIPAARINAIHALSRLNARPLDIANSRPPVPLSYSFQVMMDLYKNEKEIDGVRAAALHGLHRYSNLAFKDMTPAQKKELVDEMNKLLSSEPPASRDPAAHAYLQRFAVDILNLFRPPNDPALGTQLISISTSEKAPNLIALYSASQLGTLKPQGLQAQAKDPAPIVKKWSLRAFQSIESELARIAALDHRQPAQKQPPNPKDFLQKSATKKAPGRRPPGGMDGMGMGMGMEEGMGSDYGDEMGMDMGMDMGLEMGYGMMGMGAMAPVANPQPPEVDISRRHLTHVLQQMLIGATGTRDGEIETATLGLLAAADQPNRPALKQWVDQVVAVLGAVNDDLLDTREKWVDMLQNQRLVVGELAGLEVERPETDDDIDDGDTGLPNLPGFGQPAAAAEPEPALPGLPGA